MEEENTPQDVPSQAPRVWNNGGDKVRQTGNAWDNGEPVTQEDPEKQRTSFILQAAADKEPDRAAQVVRLSREFNLPEPEVETGFDRLSAASKAMAASRQDLAYTHPKLADAIGNSPNYAAAANKNIEQLKQLDSYYGRSADLRPQSDDQVMADSRKFAILRSTKDWAAGIRSPQGFASQVQGAADAEAGIETPSYSSQKEMEDDYYKEELQKRRSIESVIAGHGPMDLAESFTARFPGDTLPRSLFSLIPFSRHGAGISDTLDFATAKAANAAGTADEIQKDLLKQSARIAAIQQIRGKGFWSGLAEQFAGLPAMAAELGTGAVVGRAFSGAMGLGRFAGFFAEPAIASVTAGAPEIAQSFIQNKGEGDTTPEALAKATRDSYATYLAAHIFGPWFEKATPEAQALIKQSLLKAVPVEALKMPLMNAATEMMRAVGPDFVEHLKKTEAWRAIQGDPAAMESLLQQSLVGAASGLYGAKTRNSHIDALLEETQRYADDSLERGKLVTDVLNNSKELPELSHEVGKKLSAGGPNEYTRLPVQSFADYYGDKAADKATELFGSVQKYEAAKAAGVDLTIPTVDYDHVIGVDPAAAKFFANEIRPEAGVMNLREAQALEKAWKTGVSIPPRQRVIEQIMEQAKGDKIKESLGVAGADLGEDGQILEALNLKPEQLDEIKVAKAKARYSAEDVLVAKEQERRDKLKGALYEKEKARTTEEVTREVDSRKEQLALARLTKHQLPDGTPLSEDVPKIKLSREALQAEGYSESSLPKDIVSRGAAEAEASRQESLGRYRESLTKVNEELKKLGEWISIQEHDTKAFINWFGNGSEEVARKVQNVKTGAFSFAKRLDLLKSKKATFEDLKGQRSELEKYIQDLRAPNAEAYGVDPEQAALMLGFKSGHDLLLALAGTNRDLAIKQGVDSVMAGKFPLGLQPTELPQEAIRALHNENSAKYQHLVLSHLSEKTKNAITGLATRKLKSIAEIRQDANRDVRDNYTVATLDPNDFLIAEQRAHKEALTAAATGNIEDIFDARLKELNAHERYRAASDAADDIKKTLQEWVNLPEATFLNKPATADWAQQIRDLLGRIDLISVDPRDQVGMMPFDKWAEEKFQAGDLGDPITLDEKFAGDSLTSYKNLTYGDIQSLADTIDRLSYRAREVGKIRTEAGKIEVASWNERAGEFVAKNFKKLPPLPLTDTRKTFWQKVISFARSADAILERSEGMFDRLDGNDLTGPFNEGLYQPYVDSSNHYAELTRKITEKVRHLEQTLPKKIRDHLDDVISMDGVKIPVSRREIIGMVANGGNEGNYSKMLSGEELRGHGITEKVIQDLAKMLKTEELDHAQSLQDIAGMFKPEIEAMYKRLNGKLPEMVTPKQMIEAMGDRPGGYYPLISDPRYPSGQEVELKGEIGQLLGNTMRSATTGNGYIKERTGAVYPLDYNLSRLAGRLDTMAKDISFREFALNSNKLIRALDKSEVIKDHMGTEYKDFVNSWLRRSIGADTNRSDSSQAKVDRAFGTLRHNVTVAQLALKPSVFLHHALGIGPAMAEIGPKWFAQGLREWSSGWKSTYDRVVAESPEMAHYLETFDANIHESAKRLEGKTGWFADVQRLGLKVIPWGNMMRAIPTYLGAKAKAMAEFSAKGYSGDALNQISIRAAEKAVRLTSGSGRPGDVAAIMKSNFAKTLLMFHGPGSALYSRMRSAGVDFGKGDIGKFLFKSFWLLPFTAAVHALASGRIPDEDKGETWGGMIGKEALLSPTTAIPLGHDIAGGLWDIADGKRPDLSVSSPVFKALEHTGETLWKAKQWSDDEADFEDVGRELFKASGYWFGAPTEQLEISGGYLTDLLRGKSDPNDLWEFAHDVLWRKPKSRR